MITLFILMGFFLILIPNVVIAVALFKLIMLVAKMQGVELNERFFYAKMPDQHIEQVQEEMPVVSPHIKERNNLYDEKMKALQEEVELFRQSRVGVIYDEPGEDIDKRIGQRIPEEEYAR